MFSFDNIKTAYFFIPAIPKMTLPPYIRPVKKTTLTYETAYAELQAILQALQSDAVQIDELSSTLARAAELIEFCRQRLRDADQEIQKLTA